MAFLAFQWLTFLQIYKWWQTKPKTYRVGGHFLFTRRHTTFLLCLRSVSPARFLSPASPPPLCSHPPHSSEENPVTPPPPPPPSSRSLKCRRGEWVKSHFSGDEHIRPWVNDCRAMLRAPSPLNKPAVNSKLKFNSDVNPHQPNAPITCTFIFCTSGICNKINDIYGQKVIFSNNNTDLFLTEGIKISWSEIRKALCNTWSVVYFTLPTYWQHNFMWQSESIYFTADIPSCQFYSLQSSLFTHSDVLRVLPFLWTWHLLVRQWCFRSNRSTTATASWRSTPTVTFLFCFSSQKCKKKCRKNQTKR